MTPNGPSLPEMLSQLRTTLEQRTSLIIVTSNIDPIWLNNLGLLRRRGIVPTVILLNPADFGGSGKSQLIQNQLLRMGIRHYSISDKLHDFSLLKTEREELYPGERISQTAQTPIDQTANWRSLG